MMKTGYARNNAKKLILFKHSLASTRVLKAHQNIEINIEGDQTCNDPRFEAIRSDSFSVNTVIVLTSILSSWRVMGIRRNVLQETA